MKNIDLYPCFENWKEFDNIYFYSDPHFSDVDCYKLRFPERFKNLYNPYNQDPADYITEMEVAEMLDKMQIDNINKVCHKNDCLVILGDIGDVNQIKKLKAGYKVLITGNHDAGISNYKRKIETKKFKFALTEDQKEAEHKILTDWGTIFGPGDWAAIQCDQRKYTEKCILENFKSLNILDGKVIRSQKGDILVKYEHKTDTWYYFVETDNRLFDEVYDGVIPLNSKIMLSHEEFKDDYHFNIHGHTHDTSNFFHKFSKYYDSDISNDDLHDAILDVIKIEKLTALDCCAEHLNYIPISLTAIIKSGVLKDITDIHRLTIDNATERKKNKN